MIHVTDPDPVSMHQLSCVQEALRGNAGAPAQLIATECIQLAAMLLDKNSSYGNSALDPVSIFSKGISPTQKIDVRIDDKLSRIARGHEYPGDETIGDLIGYLILRSVSTAADRDKG